MRLGYEWPYVALTVHRGIESNIKEPRANNAKSRHALHGDLPRGARAGEVQRVTSGMGMRDGAYNKVGSSGLCLTGRRDVHALYPRRSFAWPRPCFCDPKIGDSVVRGRIEMMNTGLGSSESELRSGKKKQLVVIWNSLSSTGLGRRNQESVAADGLGTN